MPLIRDDRLHDRKILVVEDDPAIQRALVEILGDDSGYDVHVAGDGRSALALLKTPPPPVLILLDLMMPDMDGAAFIAQRGRDPALADIPVCLMTATGRHTPQMPGVAGVLPKPFGIDALLAVVERFARKP
ncbi:MAG TPA: response regulator [Polyangia bacterium]|nr:response regulator [Polyangia bacterium]